MPAELCSAPLAFRLPPDATLVPDLLSPEEEEEILSQLSWPGGEDGAMKHRQVGWGTRGRGGGQLLIRWCLTGSVYSVWLLDAIQNWMLLTSNCKE